MNEGSHVLVDWTDWWTISTRGPLHSIIRNSHLQSHLCTAGADWRCENIKYFHVLEIFSVGNDVFSDGVVSRVFYLLNDDSMHPVWILLTQLASSYLTYFAVRWELFITHHLYHSYILDLHLKCGSNHSASPSPSHFHCHALLSFSSGLLVLLLNINSIH